MTTMEATVTDYECWSLDESEALDDAELREGYNDGRAGAPKPGPNRSQSYHHGWWTGSSDAGHVPSQPWMRELARQYVDRERNRVLH
jgi:hypothetical protein